MGQKLEAARPREPKLSKSRLTALEQCERKLWLSVKRPDLATVDAGAEHRFAAGRLVGEIACSLCPDGVVVEAEPDLVGAVAATKRLIESGVRTPLFEATFEHDGVLVRVDILIPHRDGGWSIVEVKSSTSVKDYHLGDLATQVWVLQHSGVEVRSALIRHVNNQFVLLQIDDYVGLFADSEWLDGLEELITLRGALVERARAVLAADEPLTARGDHCSSPLICEFAEHCAAGEPLPPVWPIRLLPKTGKKVAEFWAEQGIFDLTKVPSGALAGEMHQRIHEATLTGAPYHDPATIGATVATWAWPRAYLDFETIGLAVPRWLGTRPYQNVPFQFSCHIETSDGVVEHSGFLSIDGSDPRRACAEALVDLLGQGKVGSIVAYNASFERGCLKYLAEDFPDLSAELHSISGRVVDLLPLTRGHYYHPRQRGSWSIKAVLGAIAPEMGYDGLEVGNGMQAQVAWLEATAKDTGEDRKRAIKRALEIYCERDTEAMVVLLRHLTMERPQREPPKETGTTKGAGPAGLIAPRV